MLDSHRRRLNQVKFRRVLQALRDHANIEVTANQIATYISKSGEEYKRGVSSHQVAAIIPYLAGEEYPDGRIHINHLDELNPNKRQHLYKCLYRWVTKPVEAPLE